MCMFSLNRYDDAIQLYDRILQEDSTNTVSLKDFSELQWFVCNCDYILWVSLWKNVCLITVFVSFSFL